MSDTPCFDQNTLSKHGTFVSDNDPSMGDAKPDIRILNVQSHRHCSDDGLRLAHTVFSNISDEIVKGLQAPLNAKTLPTLLLYDERGLKLYDEMTTDAPEYYLFGAEEEILQRRACEIVQVMHSRTGGILPGEVILELGAGALRKTSHILCALAGLAPVTSNHVSATYFALDLEERELRRTLTELAMSDVGSAIHGKIETKGMLGTYEDGISFIVAGGLQQTDRNPLLERYKLSNVHGDSSTPSSLCSGGDTVGTDETPPSTPRHPPLHLLFLGSSLGNFPRGEDAEFLRSLPLRPGCGDTLLLGLDHDNGREEIELAYNDPRGRTRNFVLNGLKATGTALGRTELFDLDDWEYVNLYDEDKRRHEAFYKCVRSHQVFIPGSKIEIQFLKDELVKIGVSMKYSERDACTLFTKSNLRPVQRWVDSTSRYSLWLLERPPFIFPLLSSPAASKEEIIGAEFGVPTMQDWQDIWNAWDFITLRMIPSSVLSQKPIDLRHICLCYLRHISCLLQESHTEPEEFKHIFERGIDPNPDNVIQCHAHSEVPQQEEDWPSLGSILSSKARVREQIVKLYEDISTQKTQLTRKVARVLVITLEHEGLHAETLLYMLLQRAGTGTFPPPDFTPPPWESLLGSWNAAPKPASPTVVIGTTTVILGTGDIEAEEDESPSRQVSVDTFRISWRPVTNGEFFEFYSGAGNGKTKFPASWVKNQGGEVQVWTLYGPVSLKLAWDWPVLTCYENLSVYATVKGGRIPTEPELRVFLDKFGSGYEGGANTGFRNWHPVPATTGGKKCDGKGHNGGVWEWTSTVFDKFEGFVPSRLYPRGSVDFFDGAHQVVMGGSYVTIPRITERRCLRNWYQRDYPYAWVSARVAYDM
ncbi:DUF323 domain-containing protein [Paxillus ammoniavirescens]|nr:DUF323 domain-containing protein [Paxillus ammoniavirescens]